MNTNRSATVNFYNNQSHEKPLSTVSQIQNSAVIIKPLMYPCRYHPDQICQNYCIQPKCFQVLCSECIQEHLLHHKKQNLNDLYVKSFKSVRADCSNKLIKIIDKLLSKLGILQQPKNPQQLLEQSDKTLEQIRTLMHQIIDQQVFKIRQGIKNKVSQTFSSIKQLSQIHDNLIKIINQLKQHNTIISEGIVDHQINVNDSIQKTILLNQNALLEMFEKQSHKYDQKYKGLNLDIYFNQNQFRQSAFSALKFGSILPQNIGNSHLFNRKVNLNKANTLNLNPFDQSNSRIRSRSKSPINDRSDSAISQRMYEPQIINYPILHYFQTGSNALHLIDVKSSQPNKLTINLNKFVVPTFHASIISQKVQALFISGGNIQEEQSTLKSKTMSKYSFVLNQFKKDFAIVKPRSSHSLCEDYINEHVYILGGYGQASQNQHDQSLTTFQTSLQKVNMRNGHVQQVSPSNWGGANISIFIFGHIVKICMEGIQIYDPAHDKWAKIFNIKGIELQKVYCRGAGYTVLKGSSVLIYGGYDQNQEGRKQCYLMNINISVSNLQNSSVQIQKINSTLPIAEGFWNNPGIFYQNQLYVIQNVQNQQGQPIQSERTLLKFNLQQKKWNIIKTNNFQKKN